MGQVSFLAHVHTDPAAHTMAASVDGLAALVEDVSNVEILPLPRVAHQLLALAQDDAADLARFVEVLKTDPATASGVLRAASSPVFAARTPPASLAQAVSRLGLSNVTEIALATAMRARVVRVPGWERVAEQEHRASVAVALFAQRIARSRKLNAEEAFLAGLLCDVGRQAIVATVARRRPELLAGTEALLAFVDAEHARVGARLMETWTLPPSLAAACASHHDPDPTSPLSAIVWLGDALACLALGADVDAEAVTRDVADSAAAALLNLYPEDVAALAAGAAEIRARVEVM